MKSFQTRNFSDRHNAGAAILQWKNLIKLILYKTKITANVANLWRDSRRRGRFLYQRGRYLHRYIHRRIQAKAIKVGIHLGEEVVAGGWLGG